MSPESYCPLCDVRPETLEPNPDNPNEYQVVCKRCGAFGISWEALESGLLKQPRHAKRKYLLSATCRTWGGPGIPLIEAGSIEALIARAPRLGVSEKLDALLGEAARKSSAIGSLSTFDQDDDYPLLGATASSEVGALLHALSEYGYVSLNYTLAKTRVAVTVNGWRHYEENQRAGRESSLVFVAMWFDKQTDRLYEDAILPAIKSCGYEPLRVDRHEHTNRIDDEIIGQIRRSRFMVADFTGQRHGVYFETGLMAGLGRNVIWTCRQEELADVHFDVRQYNFIAWDSVEDARTRLHNRILAIEGEGPVPRAIR
jgi:hypothetical protein